MKEGDRVLVQMAFYEAEATVKRQTETKVEVTMPDIKIGNLVFKSHDIWVDKKNVELIK